MSAARRPGPPAPARRGRPPLVRVLALAAAALCAAALARPSHAAARGEAPRPAADPAGQDPFLRPVLQDPQGRTIRLSEYRGRVRVFDVWATWCGPCRMGIPEMNTIYESYRARGVTVIGLSVDDDPAEVAQFVREVPIHYPHGMMNQEVAVLLGLGSGSMAIPITFVVDRTGRVRGHFVGLVPAARITRLIDSLL